MCTVEKRGNIYILTITSDDEHRLNPTLISSIQSKLTQIKSETLNSKSPSALITTAQGKFFSNGYDLAWANSTSNPTNSKKELDSQLQTLIKELLTFPMPTIAAVNGHAAAAGMILAVAHDYVVMRREKGYLYMSEVDIGMVIPQWFMGVLRRKVGGRGWEGWRRVVLTAEKVTAEVGRREIGVVDVVGDGVEGTKETAVAMAEALVKRGWDGVVYGENRKELLKDVLDLFEGNQVGRGGDGGEDGVKVSRIRPHL